MSGRHPWRDIPRKSQIPVAQTPKAVAEGADYTVEHCLQCGAALTPEQSGFCSTECWQADAAYDSFDDLDEDGDVPELDFDE